MRPRPKITRPVQSSQLHVKVTNRYVSFIYYTREVNDEPEMDFAFKMISK